MKIKFITLNIWQGGMLFDNAVEFIKKEKPDILCLQEVYDSHNQELELRFRTFEELQERLFWLPHSVFAPTVIDSMTKALWGSAVFSRFEITNYKRHMFDLPFAKHDLTSKDPLCIEKTPYGMIEAKMKIEGRDVYVFSIHGVWGIHGRDMQRRFEMEEVISGAVKGKETVIFAGDTNFNPDTQVSKRIENYLVSVFRTSLRSTFNMKHKDNPGFATAVVDMVFVSKNIKILSKNCPNVDVSDHLPLVVELEI